MKKNDSKILLIIIFFTFFYLIGFLTEHFAVDTYFLHAEGPTADASVYLEAGRLVMVAFLKMLGFIGLNVLQIKVFSFVLAFLSLVVSIYVFKKLLDKFTNNGKFNLLLSFLVILNPFVIEFFIFTEYTGVMCMGLMFTVLAAYSFLNFVEHGKKVNIFIAMILMFLALSSYQGIASMFICISSLFLIKHFKNFKNFVKYNIVMALIYGIPAICNLAVTRVYGSTRTAADGKDYMQSLSKIWDGFYSLIVSSSNIFPKYFFLGTFLLLLSLIVFIFVKSKSISKVIFLFYFLLISLFFTLLPQFMVATNMVWVVARSNIAIGSIIGLLILYYHLYSKNSSQAIMKVLVTIALLILTMQYIGWQRIMKDHYIVNALDCNYATFIIDKIKDYELNNNTKIKYINYYNDKSTSFIYPNTVFYGDINVRAMAIDWARKYVVDYYSGINYMTGENAEEYSDYCLTNDWNYYDDKQLNFDDNILNICIY